MQWFLCADAVLEEDDARSHAHHGPELVREGWGGVEEGFVTAYDW